MHDMYTDNPIKSVDGVAIPCPSMGGYKWNLYDVSADEAGETESYSMEKLRVGQKTKIELQWNQVSIADASKILNAFNPEYITVTFLDAMEGKYKTEEFYVGDREAPLYNSDLGKWESIKFNIIGRNLR